MADILTNPKARRDYEIIETWDTLLFSASLVVGMCLYDVRLAALALLPVPLALGLAKVSGRWVTRRTLRARHANAALTGYISDRAANATPAPGKGVFLGSQEGHAGRCRATRE